jgi:hypothetical protein
MTEGLTAPLPRRQQWKQVSRLDVLARLDCGSGWCAVIYDKLPSGSDSWQTVIVCGRPVASFPW